MSLAHFNYCPLNNADWKTSSPVSWEALCLAMIYLAGSVLQVHARAGVTRALGRCGGPPCC